MLFKNIILVVLLINFNSSLFSQCGSLNISAGPNQSICIGETIQIGGSPTASGCSNRTYSWSPNINISSTTDPNPFVNPTSTQTYTLTVDAECTWLGISCTKTEDITVTVNPLPNVTMNNLGIICVDASPIILNTGSPAGGIYSGTGVSGGYFDPSVAGVGTHTINYNYTDGNG